ncbi:MAG: ABC transporter ATP-binding protein/permease [Oligoflexia bacterium]|nr:ABC transporter ATP-binding protein/permease [Oligoflexia bacterium]
MSQSAASARRSGFLSAFLEDSSFLREYLWKYRKPVFWGMVSLIVVDILEVIPPILLKESIDAAIDNKPLRLLAYFALAYLGVALLQGVCRWGWRVFLIRASQEAGRDLRGRFAGHLFGLPASFFDKRPIGELMSLATSDVEAVRFMIGAGLLTLADALFYFITVPIAMFWLSPELTLLAFIPLPVIPWLVLRNQRAIHERFEKLQERFAAISAMTQEALGGIRVIKAFAKEDAQADRFRSLGEDAVRASLRLARVQTAFGPTLDFTMSLGMVFLLYVGGRALISEEAGTTAAVSLGTFVAFQRYIQKMVWPMAALGMALGAYQKSVTSSNRLKEVLARRTDVPEDENSEVPRLEAVASGWRTAGKVEFRDLSFRFPGSARDALSGITLTVEPGERVAFVGAVGAGKSALLSLLPRLYPVGRGMLLIDGVDVNRWPLEELRRQVGFVSQDVFLFSETVVENIAYGLHGWMEARGGTAPENSPVEEATQLACVHEDVIGFSGSYATRVGERGVNLSGGQKQRLTIARAIVKKPSILVLDDALSSVDVQTEERILRGLRSRPGRNTEIIAAHRISTIQDADRIVVLEDGRVRQVGTHQELLADQRGAYRKFHEEQRLKTELESYSELLDAAVERGGGA